MAILVLDRFSARDLAAFAFFDELDVTHDTRCCFEWCPEDDDDLSELVGTIGWSAGSHHQVGQHVNSFPYHALCAHAPRMIH